MVRTVLFFWLKKLFAAISMHKHFPYYICSVVYKYVDFFLPKKYAITKKDVFKTWHHPRYKTVVIFLWQTILEIRNRISVSFCYCTPSRFFFVSFTFTKDACEWRRSVIIKYNTKIRIYIQALHRIVPLLSKATVVPISIYGHEGVSWFKMCCY